MSDMDFRLVNALIELAKSTQHLIEDVRTGEIGVDVEEKWGAEPTYRHGYTVRLRRDASVQDSVQL